MVSSLSSQEAVPDGATVDVLQLAGNFAEVRSSWVGSGGKICLMDLDGS